MTFLWNEGSDWNVESIEIYQQSKERGVRWLLEQLNPDGSIGPVEAGFNYYRLPWTFTIAGETRHAIRLCDWVRHHQFAANGDFTGVSPRGLEAYAYENAVFVFGAQLARQFDLSYRGYQRLLAHFDVESGGFRHLPEGNGIPADENIPTVAQAGKTALMIGDLSTAERVGEWFQRVWDAQLELPERLYYVWSADSQSLVTEFPAERATSYMVEAQGTRQRFTCGGIAAAFLARLYQATSKPDYLELAKAYQAFSMNSTERQFEVPQVCKTGWGSSLLYEITGEPIYRDWTVRLGGFYVATQRPDGHWENRAPYNDFANHITVTAEFVMHLDTLIGALSLPRAAAALTPTPA
jgi:hypothetical protein